MIVKIYGRNVVKPKHILPADQNDLNDAVYDLLNEAIDMGLINFPEDDNQANKMLEVAADKVFDYYDKYKQLCCGDYMLVEVNSINDVSIPDMVGSDVSFIF